MCIKEIIMQCIRYYLIFNNIYSGLFLYVCHDECAVFFLISTTHMSTTVQNTRYLPLVQKVYILTCSWHVRMTHALHCMHKCGLQLAKELYNSTS